MKVDFYLLNHEESRERWLFACHLLEQAYTHGHRVFVFCEQLSDVELLDELLWTFKEDSFIPHNIQGEGLEPPPPIQIGCEGEPRGYNDILLNLSSRIPAFHTRFQRIMEIVPGDESAKEICREHYRLYRQNRYELQTHTITDNHALPV